MATSYAVVGEHRDDPDRLLLLGDDGRHYVLDLPDTVSTLPRVDDEWTIDPEIVPPGVMDTIEGSTEELG